MKLATARLVFRPADEGDLDFYFELRNRPEILALPGREPRPRSDVERQLRGWIQQWDECGFGAWTLFDRETNERLGRVELDPIGSGWVGLSSDPIEVGCVVHPSHWNRGIATEATLLVAADCFSRVGLDRLVALTTIDNKPALRALEKVGMRRSGETHYADDHTAYEVFELAAAPQGASSALG
jgi:[ribosomal protein S5]-alanine N-acetyltransferase